MLFVKHAVYKRHFPCYSYCVQNIKNILNGFDFHIGQDLRVQVGLGYSNASEA